MLCSDSYLVNYMDFEQIRIFLKFFSLKRCLCHGLWCRSEVCIQHLTVMQ